MGEVLHLSSVDSDTLLAEGRGRGSTNRVVAKGIRIGHLLPTDRLHPPLVRLFVRGVVIRVQ